MLDAEFELMQREARTAHRLSRLFRVERTGRLERWPVEIVRRLTHRRGLLVEELLRLEAKRRSFGLGPPIELDRAIEALAEEVGSARESCEDRLAELGAALRRLRGEGTATGLRDRTAGRLLGRG